MVYACRQCGNAERFVEEYLSGTEKPFRQPVRIGRSGAAIPMTTDPWVAVPDVVYCAACGVDDVSVATSLLLAA